MRIALRVACAAIIIVAVFWFVTRYRSADIDPVLPHEAGGSVDIESNESGATVCNEVGIEDNLASSLPDRPSRVIKSSTASPPPAAIAGIPVSGDTANVVDSKRIHQSETDAADKQARTVGKLLTLDEVPESPLRSSLMKLSDDALQKALHKLSTLEAPLQDANSLRADMRGGVYYVCSFQTDSSSNLPHDHVEKADHSIQEREGGADGVVVMASVPISSPPIRHSNPGATKVLFLDFNGHDITDTIWNNNASYGNVATFECRPFDTDGDESTFSDLEQQYIIEIWERVAEDYMPFDVDVTTEQPASWNSQVGHALITPWTDKNGENCPHNTYGGLAYVDYFGSYWYSYDVSGCVSPAWIWSEMGSSRSYADVAEAASHELGHNLGLSHDGTSSLEYYGGHGSDNVSWGPLMGTGYYRNLSQWCKGEYYDANRTQDDLAIIAAKLTYRTDDHGDNNGSATAISVVNNTIASTTGLVEQVTDVDVFSLSLPKGTVSIDIDPYICASATHGGNLDISATLYDGASSLIASNNPADQTYADISATIPSSGTYYLHVTGVGTGTPLNNPPSGYTSYGSIGQFFISGSAAPSLQIVVSTNVVSINEGSTVGFQVKLSEVPSGTTVVSVTKVGGGDGNISVDSGSSLTFTTSNWGTYQPVTLGASEDADWENGTATIRCSASGLADVDVSASENDNDDFNALPYEESFESYTNGHAIEVVRGWSAAALDAAVVSTNALVLDKLNNDYTGVFPIATTHTKVLYINGSDATNAIRSTTEQIVSTDFMLLPYHLHSAPTVDATAQLALYVDADSQLNVLHAATTDEVGFTDEWHVLTNSPVIADQEWVRITILQDYSSKMFQVSINEAAAISDGKGWTGAGGTQPGSWFYMVDRNNEYMSTFEVQNNAYLDDLSVSEHVIPPGSATSPTPSDGAVDVGPNADMSWTPHVDADSHNVYFGGSTPLDTGDYKGNQSGTSYDPGTMARSATYYWRIDEVNAGGTNTGTEWSFTTVPDAPGQASSPTPANGAVDVATNAAMGWTAGSGASSHNVYGDTTSPPTTLLTNQTGTTYDPGALATDTTYYWRIDEVNAGGTNTGSEWSYTTIPNLPADATGPSPADSATDVALDADMSWTAGAGATSHDVYGGTNTPLSSADFIQNQSGVTYDPGTLAYDTTYYWRIDEVNAGGTNTGTQWSYTTTSAPPAYVNITNEVPYSESFESYAVGFELSGTNGWYASASTEATVSADATTLAALNAYSSTWGYPLEDGHTRYLAVTGDTTNKVTSDANRIIYLDTMLQAIRSGDEPEIDSPETTHAAVLFDMSGNPMVFHHDRAAGTNRWTTLGQFTLEADAWTRVTFCCDYQTDDSSYGRRYFSIWIDGVKATNALAYTQNDGYGTSGGPWFAMPATTAPDGIEWMEILNQATLDDLVINEQAPFVYRGSMFVVR